MAHNKRNITDGKRVLSKGDQKILMVYRVVDGLIIEVFRNYSNMEYGKGTSETYSIEMLTAVLSGVIRSEEVNQNYS